MTESDFDERTNGPGAERGPTATGRETDIATAGRLAAAVQEIEGIDSLVPGMRDVLVDTMARLTGNRMPQSVGHVSGVDVTRVGDRIEIGIDLNLAGTRSAAAIADDIRMVVARRLGEGAAVNIRIMKLS